MGRGLLLGFVSNDWAREADFESLERIDGSYISDDLRLRHDDVSDASVAQAVVRC